MKQIRVKEIIDFLGDKVLNIYGVFDNLYIDNLADAEHVNEHTLDWVNANKQNKQEIAEVSKAKCLLVDETVEYTNSIQQQEKVLIVVKNPRKTMADIANHFFVEQKEPGIHPTAVIDPSAIIDPIAHIGPGCIVGKAKIGKGTVLMPNVVIYDHVTIGDNCLIQN